MRGDSGCERWGAEQTPNQSSVARALKALRQRVPPSTGAKGQVPYMERDQQRLRWGLGDGISLLGGPRREDHKFKACLGSE